MGSRKFKHVMLDLRSTVNIMLALVYSKFQLHIMHHADIIVYVVNLSLVRHLGLVKDVLVIVDDLLFPMDFYVVNVNTSSPPYELFGLLGKLFLNTTKVVIDVDKGYLRIKHGEKFQTYIMIDDSSSTNFACFTSYILQDSSLPPKSGVKDVGFDLYDDCA